MSRAYYSDSIDSFRATDSHTILGLLAKNHHFALEELQRDAWITQIEILKHTLDSFPSGYILFEYSIPRMGKRIDTVVLVQGLVIALEFKVGETRYSRSALDQVLDYALDLKNFHEQSHNKVIIPVLVATNAPTVSNAFYQYHDAIFAPLMGNEHSLGDLLGQIVAQFAGQDFDPTIWRDSLYKPTPTIVEAAQALYRGHTVAEISRSDAGAINLSLTAEAVASIIDQAKANKQKVICFVTGVPGAGKTLAGLNIANERLRTTDDDFAVFLSGNGPLVTVLRHALAQDDMSRESDQTGAKPNKKQALAKASAFIQNIHHFRDDALKDDQPPPERVVIFDEAQRAWTLKQTKAFMERKRGVQDFNQSESEFLISYMDRHSDWAAIVCLVGGGQEINTGEAGIVEWWKSVGNHFPRWEAFVSPHIEDEEYTQGHNINEFFNPDQLHFDARLHLAVSMRSFRAESVSKLVKAILDNDLDLAKALFRDLSRNYPIAITRDIDRAKAWLCGQARGSERFGFLASSGAARLRPLGFSIDSQIDVVNWFLADKADIRSSYFLEVVASEFDVQGLELDWVGVLWDADLRYSEGNWQFKLFSGTRWKNVNDEVKIRYLKNAYRVLLTRARQGMVIVVPNGDDADHTRQEVFYDGVYEYLCQVGFEPI